MMGNVGNGVGYALAGAGVLWEISALSSQFCCESTTALKKSLFNNKNEGSGI